MVRWWLLLAVFVAASTGAQGYDRDEWNHWMDYDADCMDLRHELLAETSMKPTTKDGRGCRIANGVWQGPYTGLYYSDSKSLDLDHVVPLSWAHDHGGAGWSDHVKELFANDRENLLLVDLRENRSKGARGPDEYMPKIGQCAYLIKWKRIINRYRLSPDFDIGYMVRERGCR